METRVPRKQLIDEVRVTRFDAVAHHFTQLVQEVLLRLRLFGQAAVGAEEPGQRRRLRPFDDAGVAARAVEDGLLQHQVQHEAQERLVQLGVRLAGQTTLQWAGIVAHLSMATRRGTCFRKFHQISTAKTFFYWCQSLYFDSDINDYRKISGKMDWMECLLGFY